MIKWGIAIPALGAAGLLAGCDDGAPGAVAGPPTGAPPPAGGRNASAFTLAVLPDTQFYSRYATAEYGNQFNKLYGSEPYRAQTKWLVDHAEQLNIPMVIHVGDVVDRASVDAEWTVADAAMKVLEDAKLPYTVVAGNHDVRDSGQTEAARDLSQEKYLKHFTRERAAANATFGGRDPTGFHEYHVFEAQGVKFLVIGLSWRPSDAALQWAQGVLQRYPDMPTILYSHEIINIDTDQVTALETKEGLELWDKLINRNDQIFMTLNGHFHGSATLVKKNAYGNDVFQMVVDYQMAYQGGNGLMRLYEFDFTHNQMRAITVSPWVPQKPKGTLNQFDQAVLRESNHAFTLDINFAQRFRRFHPNFQANTAKLYPPLTMRALGTILDGFEEVPPPPAVPAKNVDDYAKVASTTAHWRFFGGTPGTPVPAAHVIADASGKGNPLTRAPLNFPANNTAQLGDMVWSGDHHHLSAAPGSIEFRNTAGSRLSYLWTDVNAAINDDEYRDGYTIEAFVKIGANWTATANAWMNIMTREGRRGNIKGWYGSYAESPPLQFAVSNLRELQWEVASYWSPNPAYILARTNWSGEIMVDRWLHVAIVHEKEGHTTTMYVEGAPILRNINESSGLANLAKRWVIGAGFWNGGDPEGGFLGSLGEIRITPEPLGPDKWLTARAG